MTTMDPSHSRDGWHHWPTWKHVGMLALGLLYAVIVMLLYRSMGARAASITAVLTLAGMIVVIGIPTAISKILAQLRAINDTLARIAEVQAQLLPPPGTPPAELAQQSPPGTPPAAPGRRAA